MVSFLFFLSGKKGTLYSENRRRINLGIKNSIKILFIFLVLGFLCGTAAAQASDSTGNRVWDANAGESLNYTWSPQTYSGFYYDLDTGEGSENLTIQLGQGSRTIQSRGLKYETKPITTSFEHSDWGSYQVIGFMAERYFAGYTQDSVFANDNLSVLSQGQLAKVLIDNDDRRSLYAGSSLVLEDGYTLDVAEVDVNGNSVWMQLKKDGKVIDDAFLTSNSDYVYQTKIGSMEDVPIIAVHLAEIFSGRETNAVFVRGVFQISDKFTEVSNGDEFGEMEVSSVSESGITMRNKDSITLGKGDTIDIMGKLNFLVADSDVIRFAPTVEPSESGSYESRGTVHDEKFDTLVWTPFNFEGFYYNIDENISTESLTIENLNGRTIESDSLIYSTTPALVQFEHEAWGSYQVLGFMAEKYFVGYPANTFGNSKSISILSDNALSKVLIDDDDKRSMFTGSSLELDNGYSLKTAEVDVNGENVLFELYKDGKLLDSGIVPQNGDYIYETDIGGAENVPMIAAHISTVFRSTETDAVFIQGLFQISDEYLKLSQDDSFGEMEITTLSSSGITMKNKDSISLSSNDIVDLMGNIKFKIADNSSVLRFYPFVESKVSPGDQLEIKMPDTLVVGKPVNILVTARNASVGGVELSFGTQSIGTTGDDGNLSYTPSGEGSFVVSANKTGYVSGTKNVQVVGEGTMKLLVSISPQSVREGDQIVIKVTDALNNQPVAGADVFFGIQKLDQQTNANGTLSYWVTTPGTYTVNATKAGYQEGNTTIEVIENAAIFTFSNLKVEPPSVQAGDAVNISVNATNTGTVKGETAVELFVNNRSVATQNISLSPGESSRVGFSHTEDRAGRYTVQIDDQTETYQVVEKTPITPGIAIVGVLVAAFVLLWIGRNE